MTVVSGEVPTTSEPKAALKALLAAASNRLLYPAVGCAILLSVWWFGGYPSPAIPTWQRLQTLRRRSTFAALHTLISSGDLVVTITSSLYRILIGLLWGVLIGVP